MLKVLCISVWLIFHPVHVTLTSVDYDRGTNLFKVFVKMYFDDFLRDAKLCGRDAGNVNFSVNDTSSIGFLNRYINEKVILTVNEKKRPGIVHDLNLTENEISMNIEYSKIRKPKTISVKNQIMIKLYGDMANMLIVRVNNFEEGVRVSPELTEKTFVVE